MASDAGHATLANASGVALTHARQPLRPEHTITLLLLTWARPHKSLISSTCKHCWLRNLTLSRLGKTIAVGGTFSPIYDMGVTYYNPGGGK